MVGGMADLVSCPSCNRNNGVTRTACIYCGAELPVTAETIDRQVPITRPVEEWEHGFSVVLAPVDADEPTPHQLARLCEIARMDEEMAKAVLAARVPLPVLRVATVAEAELSARLLDAAGLRSSVLADDDLGLDHQTRRVRELNLGPQMFQVRLLWADWERMARGSLVLAVEGRIVATKIEIVETARRGRKLDLTDTSQYFVESYVVDLYGPTLEQSYRVKADSFDFSCLGAPPSPRLEENVAAFGELLSTYLGPSRYDASYGRVAKLVEHAWPAASQVQSLGLSRRGDFKKYTRSSLTTDGLGQFTRYSRMRYALSGLTGPRA